MKILVALDGKDYSRKIIKDISRLAENTLADMVFLGIQESSGKLEELTVNALVKYQEDLYSYFSPEELPYADFSADKWQELAKGDWGIIAKGMKEFSLRIKTGSVAQQTIAVAKELECDLIILGCGSEFGCEWDGEMNVPLRIAEDAPCSVLVIKQAGNTDQIVSILDKSVISQDALEMVNQLVTLHGAGLKIVGVKEKKSGKKDALEKRMVKLLKYYNDREINAWVKLIDSDEVKDYVTRTSQEAIVALWKGGKQSIIKRLLSRSIVDRLLETSKSSLLILR